MRNNFSKTVLAPVLVLSLAAGCAQAPGKTNGSDNTAGNDAGTGSISIMINLHNPEVPSDKIEKLLEEKTNTQLDIQWVPDGTYNDKLYAAFATGSLPQVVYTQISNFREAIIDGQFWEVGPLLKDYPNLNRFQPEVLKNTAVNGKIYSMYQESPISRQGVIYRKDWADQLGIKAPETLEELYSMMKQFKENDPDKNGKNDTIGLTDRNDFVYGAFKTLASYHGTPNNWGVQDGKLQPDFMFPAYIETMKYIQKLHKEGIINQDFPVTSKTDQQNLFISGKAGVYIGSMQDVVSLQDKIAGVNPKAQLDVLNRIKGPKGEGIWALPGYGAVVLFPKSSVKTEKELKDILAFYDKLMSPELANLLVYGVENTHYKLVEGSKVSRVEDNKLIDKEVKPYNSLRIGGPSTIKLLEQFYSNPIQKKAEGLVKDNEKFLIHDPTAPLFSATYTERAAKLQEIIKDATYRFMLGSLDEQGFKKEVERWRKEGGDKITEEYNAAYTSSQNAK
ncbi:extracellular solute-binding protein [Paenibacillus sp. GD4]|uniref:extracellular solute-binding protein n=1 Tax=Paenibacillus sp. GD4 TaxID=3068890 RepID=UPI0027968BE5|nr:extracellular solute-binding protein [Paenibacillus sp. GD4]MDQ1912664.1 extracellular solute-binding protein [Paenibacillus sp. GD4]